MTPYGHSRGVKIVGHSSVKSRLVRARRMVYWMKFVRRTRLAQSEWQSGMLEAVASKRQWRLSGSGANTGDTKY